MMADTLSFTAKVDVDNLTTRDSPKWTLESGPCSRERRGSGPAKQKPKHNPCTPVGRNWKVAQRSSKSFYSVSG